MAVSGKKAPEQFSLTTQSIASDKLLQLFCQPCDEERTRLPAHGYCSECKEHLCKTCFKAHKITRLTKHHTLLDASNMPTSLSQPSTFISTDQSDNLIKPCLKHPKETIKFYCDDHDKLLCSVCVTLEHQAVSCKVDYIPDISGNIMDSKEYQIIFKAVTTISNQIKQKLKYINEMTIKSNNSLHDVLKDIKQFWLEINQRLDEMERQAENEVNVIEEGNNKNLKATETMCEDMMKSLKTSSDTIKQLNASKQADKLFMELKLTEKKMKDVEEKILQATSYEIKRHIFESNWAILSKLETEESLGTKKTLDQETVLKSRQSIHQEKIYVKTSEDRRKCWITGLTILSPDLIVITDYCNNSVKMVDTSSRSVIDQLQLDDEPWDVTAVRNTKVAVTLPLKKLIQFISITINIVKKKHTMNMGGVCHGICCHRGKLVVLFNYPAKLQILDMDGTPFTTIHQNTFQCPRYVTCTIGSIYVSDYDKKTVTKLNFQGEVIGCFSGMSKPTGIELSGDGSVFVCVEKREVITEISGDCSTESEMLKNLVCPWAVCWCGETKKLYFSCHSTNETYCNFLHIYELS